MIGLKLEELDARILIDILNDVRRYKGCYDEQSMQRQAEVKVSINILNQLQADTLYKSRELDELKLKVRVNASSTNERLDCIESNIKMMIGVGLLTNENRIVKLESLVRDLTTVYNKHSNKGVDDQ